MSGAHSKPDTRERRDWVRKTIQKCCQLSAFIAKARRNHEIPKLSAVLVHMRVEYQGWISYSFLIINKERVKSCYMGWS